MSTVSDDRRLIEDYLPIVDISAEASREKNVRRGHISTLHLWWARRPLVACRAAVYGALVPASQFVPNGGTDAQKKSLGRANAAKFITSLCKYPGTPQVIKEAQTHILKAHAERLSTEQGKKVTVEDILAGRAPRPRVLDMFAGGGAIPLEASRLGCDAYALDLNPVAHIIQLCTLVYPQKFGKPDANARGMTGSKNAKGETTWGGLAEEVRHWGDWVLQKVKAEIGDLYPLIPDPEFRGQLHTVQEDLPTVGSAKKAVPPGFLTPMAYLWTRTVTCKNPNCHATVPLVKQTWLCKKKDRYVALKVVAPLGKKQVRFEVVKASSEKDLGIDPEAFSKGGNATCPFCGTVADADFVQDEGIAKRVGMQLMAIVCVRPNLQGRVYLSSSDVPSEAVPEPNTLQERITHFCERTGLAFPNEPIGALRPSPNARGLSAVTRHGLRQFSDLFTARQVLSHLCYAHTVKEVSKQIDLGERACAVTTTLALVASRCTDWNSANCRWFSQGESNLNTFGRHALPMLWDFCEANAVVRRAGSFESLLDALLDALPGIGDTGRAAECSRGTATHLNAPNQFYDAVITDPPYYDNIPYADISDYFYIWLKRTIGSLYPEHFATDLTPKKSEATALSSRHGGDMAKANAEYEKFIFESFREAFRVLKADCPFVIVYAHKSTLGWATLVDALRRAGFMVTEAWPLDTEMGSRLVAADASALASSIFLVARKRDGAKTGSYEEVVRSELEEIVRERVETLWDMGISGADLVIASVGAGLRAFTRFATVEYANGEEVPAERFLTEVETVVLETILSRLSKEVGGKGGQYSLASLDTSSRFYVLWRYTYGAAELDAGEAIIFANGTHVELDGQHGLTGGNDALVEKKKSKYRLRDFAERGGNDKLGLPADNGQPAPLIDMLHRTLWLLEKRPTELGAFLSKAQPNREQLRLVAQALGGPALKGGEMGDISPTAELSALGKLTANWQSLIEDSMLTTGEREEKRTGQKQLI